MASGIKASDGACIAHQDLMKAHKYHYVIYEISDTENEVVVIHTEPNPNPKQKSSIETMDAYKNETFKGFEKFVLARKDPCFASLNYEYLTKDGIAKDIVLFVWWSPDATAKIGKKMKYSSTQKSFKEKLGINTKIVQGNEPSDINYEAILEMVNAV